MQYIISFSIKKHQPDLINLRFLSKKFEKKKNDIISWCINPYINHIISSNFFNSLKYPKFFKYLKILWKCNMIKFNRFAQEWPGTVQNQNVQFSIHFTYTVKILSPLKCRSIYLLYVIYKFEKINWHFKIHETFDCFILSMLLMQFFSRSTLQPSSRVELERKEKDYFYSPIRWC